MKYQRKTTDEYTLQGSYGQGWEDLTSEESFKAIKERLKDYRDNEPGGSFRWIKRRVKKAN